MEIAQEITALDMHLSGLRDSQAGLFSEIERIAAGESSPMDLINLIFYLLKTIDMNDQLLPTTLITDRTPITLKLHKPRSNSLTPHIPTRKLKTANNQHKLFFNFKSQQTRPNRFTRTTPLFLKSNNLTKFQLTWSTFLFTSYYVAKYMV